MFVITSTAAVAKVSTGSGKAQLRTGWTERCSHPNPNPKSPEPNLAQSPFCSGGGGVGVGGGVGAVGAFSAKGVRLSRKY